MKFRAEPKVAGEGGGNFLRLKDGESVKGILQGEPYEFRTLWSGGRPQVVAEGTPKSSFRFRMNIVIKENDKYVMKIWEQGAIVYNTLKGFSEEYDLEKTVLKVTRQGSTKDNTDYAIVPLPGGVDAKLQGEISKLTLHELKEKPQVGTPLDEIPFPSNDDEIPF